MIRLNKLTEIRWKKFKTNKTAYFSLCILVVMIFLGITAKFWANSDPHILHYQGKTYFPLFKYYHPSTFDSDETSVMNYRGLKLGESDWAFWPVIRWNELETDASLAQYPAPPSRAHFFGTDDRGRDVLTRLLFGLQSSFFYAFGTWLLSYFIGVSFGCILGFFGGKVDLIGMRLVEIFESIPYLLILITLTSIFSPNLAVLVLLSSLFNWTGIAQFMRGQVLSLRHQEFVESARALGAGPIRLIFYHLLPNALTPIVTFSPFTIAAAISSLSLMDYLGLGIQAPAASWGELLSQAQKYFSTAEWLVWAPSGALLITLTLLINVGLAVRDAFDSKLK